ncbi:MAG: TolC family protein, partial [Zavarzinella sp.]|nr:TolC family protein [Zavarzinella sp.]
IEIKELPPSPAEAAAAIDLVPLARPNPGLGTWRRDGDTLVCTPRPKGDPTFQVLPIPVALPPEYELEADFERVSGDDTFGVNLTAGGTAFAVLVDGWPSLGGWSGLARIDKKQPHESAAGVHGRHVVNGRRHLLRCTVRAAGVTATVDGQSIVDYPGPFDRLDAESPAYDGTKFYVRVHGTNGCRIHRLRLTRPPPGAGPPAGVVTALRDAVAAKERSLNATKVRQEVGALSELDVTLAQIELTEARVRLAEAEGDRAALIARLQELVAQRQTERDFTEQLIQAGRTAPNVLHDVDARLAAARARLSQARPGPPTDPQPVKLRSFTPGKDPLPLPQRGPASAVTAVGDAWRIENTTNAGDFNVLVAQAIDNLPKDGVLVFRAKVKFEAKERDEARWGELGFGSAKEVYPAWDQWPEVRARYGDYIVDWTEKEARYPAAEVLKKGATVYLYAGLHANGVLWLKDVELLHLPAAPAPPPAVAPLDEKKGKGQ